MVWILTTLLLINAAVTFFGLRLVFIQAKANNATLSQIEAGLAKHAQQLERNGHKLAALLDEVSDQAAVDR